MTAAAFNLRGLKASEKILRTHTRVRATIFPHDTWDRKTDAIVIDSTQQNKANFRSLTWSKRLGRATGDWMLTLKDNPKGKGIGLSSGAVFPGDWVLIEIERNGIRLPLCLGPLFSVRRKKSVDPSGKQTVLWTLTGNDHGKLFEMPLAYQSIWVRTFDELNLGLFTKAAQGAASGSPEQLFRIFIEAAFGAGTKTGTWKLPPALAERYDSNIVFPDFLSLLEIKDKDRLRGVALDEQRMWTNPGQFLMQTLQSWCNAVMNEILVDWNTPDDDLDGSGGTFPPLMAQIRERPYVNVLNGLDSPWFSLPTWDIPKWAIRDEDMGMSDAERFNLIELQSDVALGNSTVETAAFAPPVWNRDSIERYGFRPM